MTSSQLVTLVAAVMVCSAGVVYSQTASPIPNEPPTTQAPATQPPAAMTSSARPPVTTPAPVDPNTDAPPAGASTASPDMGVETSAPMASDDGHDGDNDNDNDDGDMDDHDDDKKGGNGGLRDGDIALAVLATLLICATIGTFLGLCYWKYKGTSYVTVTADTTYRQ